MLDAEEALGISPDEISAEQGFLDENGDFITRAEVAQRSGMPPRTFATSEDLTNEGMVNPIPREPPNVVKLPPITPRRGLGEAGKIGINRAFHGTVHEGFDVPTKGSAGVHVGTPSQADWFAERLHGRTIPVWAKVTKELPTRDLGAWYSDRLIDAAEDAGGLPKDVANALRDRVANMESEIDARAAVLEAIRQQGYDAITYTNVAEGKVPAESMIILDPIKNLRNALEHPTPESAFPEATDLPKGALEDVEYGSNVARAQHFVGMKAGADIADPATGEVLMHEGELFTPEKATRVGQLVSEDQMRWIERELKHPGQARKAATQQSVEQAQSILKQKKILKLDPGQEAEGAKPFFPEEEGGVSPLFLPGMAGGAGGALALMLKLQQMRQKNK